MLESGKRSNDSVDKAPGKKKKNTPPPPAVESTPPPELSPQISEPIPEKYEYVFLPSALRIQKTQIISVKTEEIVESKFSDYIDIKIEAVEKFNGRTYFYSTLMTPPSMEPKELDIYFNDLKKSDVESLKKYHFSTWATLDWWLAFFQAMNKTLFGIPNIFVFKRSLFYENCQPWIKVLPTTELVFSNPPIYKIEYHLNHLESFESKIVNLPLWVTKLFKENPFEYEDKNPKRSFIARTEIDYAQPNDPIDSYFEWFLKKYSQMASDQIEKSVKAVLEERIFLAGATSSQAVLKSVKEALEQHRTTHPEVFISATSRKSQQGRKSKGSTTIPVVLIDEELKLTEVNGKSQNPIVPKLEISFIPRSESINQLSEEAKPQLEETHTIPQNVIDNMIEQAPLPDFSNDQIILDIPLTNHQPPSQILHLNKNNFVDLISQLSQKPSFVQ